MAPPAPTSPIGNTSARALMALLVSLDSIGCADTSVNLTFGLRMKDLAFKALQLSVNSSCVNVSICLHAEPFVVLLIEVAD